MTNENHKIKSIYNYILDHNSEDSDFWSMGGGSNEIQKKLNTFLDEDWSNLKTEIVKWDNDYIDIILVSITFGFDGMFVPCLHERLIPNAGNFLLDMFIFLDNFDQKYEIAFNSFFINTSNSNKISELKLMKNWMIENGFNKKEWLNLNINPLKNIIEAINKTST
ncbi:hypothetical protein SGQ83_10205 [Flavobacterium sp. Fl-318]|uniref:Uncharacterized protein n=1 Tax=Flavobacterium cupriresistens TaxID=2893885 RepID=A0ABU4RAX2_9FLAO|nr:MULTISPECIES: hypothetical protein [unclassified Flavobacterium]MDX6189724.1 hypothetical protein [Flavobacterium sp. Fl-318]UFH40870.1 hypothetical protein LNP23_13750 [Flavobacterium sp. F-323]